MARTKFTFEKRQKEIARKKKQEDKAARRAELKLLRTDMPQGTKLEREVAPEDRPVESTPPEEHTEPIEKEG